MFVDLAADRDLNSLGRPGGLPAAREPQELAQHRDDQDQRHQRRPGAPWAIQGAQRGSTPRSGWQGMRQDDVVDHALVAAGGINFKSVAIEAPASASAIVKR